MGSDNKKGSKIQSQFVLSPEEGLEESRAHEGDPACLWRHSLEDLTVG